MKRIHALLAVAFCLICGAAIGLAYRGEAVFKNMLGAYLSIEGIKSREIQLHGHTFHLYQSENRGKKAVILLHGLGGDALYTWFRLMPSLAEKYHIIAIDLLYRRFQDLDEKRYTLRNELAIITALLDAEGIASADIVGLSVGAWVGAQLAARYPDRVEKLVCIAPAGLDARGLLSRAQVLRDVDARGFYDLLFFNPPPFPDFILNLHSANLRRSSEDLLACLERLAVSEESIAIDAQEVRVPVLIVWGQNDRLLPPADAPILAEAFPDARVLLLENCGHAVVWDRADALATAVKDFLAAPDH
jgi:pimeloyl-ACP methyl ester carboxylesterase